MGVLCFNVAEVAVMVMVAETGVRAERPPQAEAHCSATTASASSIQRLKVRLLHQNAPVSPTNAKVGSHGVRCGALSIARAPAVNVSWVVTAFPAGVKVAGTKLQETAAGCPEHAKLITPTNPFCGVIVKVTLP
jgi:hypothetical protein